MKPALNRRSAYNRPLTDHEQSAGSKSRKALSARTWRLNDADLDKLIRGNYIESVNDSSYADLKRRLVREVFPTMSHEELRDLHSVYDELADQEMAS